MNALTQEAARDPETTLNYEETLQPINWQALARETIDRAKALSQKSFQDLIELGSYLRLVYCDGLKRLGNLEGKRWFNWWLQSSAWPFSTNRAKSIMAITRWYLQLPVHLQSLIATHAATWSISALKKLCRLSDEMVTEMVQKGKQTVRSIQQTMDTTDPRYLTLGSPVTDPEWMMVKKKYELTEGCLNSLKLEALTKASIRNGVAPETEGAEIIAEDAVAALRDLNLDTRKVLPLSQQSDCIDLASLEVGTELIFSPRHRTGDSELDGLIGCRVSVVEIVDGVDGLARIAITHPSNINHIPFVVHPYEVRIADAPPPNLSAELHVLQQRAEEFAAQRNYIGEVEQQLTSVREERDQLDKQLEASQRELTSVKESENRTKEQLAIAQEQLCQSQKEKERLAAELTLLKEKKKDSENPVTDREEVEEIPSAAEFAAHRNYIGQMEQKLTSTGEQLAQLDKQLEASQRELTAVKESENRTKEQLAIAQEQLCQSQKEKEQLTAELTSFKEKNAVTDEEKVGEMPSTDERIISDERLCIGARVKVIGGKKGHKVSWGKAIASAEGWSVVLDEVAGNREQSHKRAKAPTGDPNQLSLFR